MSDGRERILGAVRQHLAAAPDAPPAAHPAPSPAPAARSTDAVERADQPGRLAAFEQRLAAVGGHVHRAATAADAARHIDAIAARHGASPLRLSDAALLEPVRPHLRTPVATGEASTEDLLACACGVTGAQWGIAETGSLVLVAGAERHRRLSLLPPVHVAVLPADRVVATLGEALRLARGTDGAPPPVVTLVTGPSRTADIELTLVVGVHGPKELHVVLLG